MAVALDAGLIVPVIRDTASRDLASLASESKRLADAARAGSLQLAELEGGTISVSTLGMFGVDMFTPVINPPNTAIVGVGRLRDDVVLDADANVGVTKRLTLSLTWDHRAFDGAPAAAFCQAVAALLNDPTALDTRTAGTS
jgi:pyruvate dehydrogenase E2 component (dihydrolipoamide acetyltransferase)